MASEQQRQASCVSLGPSGIAIQDERDGASWRCHGEGEKERTLGDGMIKGTWKKRNEEG